LVTGGCRSGKSRYALELGETLRQKQLLFLATCQPEDEEMKQRVADHQKQRGSEWQVLEAPFRLPETIIEKSRPETVMIVDCITLWISNLLQHHHPDKIVRIHIPALIEAIQSVDGRLIFVTNEVGAGIVPENRLARIFRDAVGLANQKIAAASDRVVWMVAGIPVIIKG
jgi:adenosylcobinamide kinase/adenosylcobinamide-phosphate guanylyltransferase